MVLKEFFKPTWIKILITIILLLITLFYKWSNHCIGDVCRLRGLPIPFADEIGGKFYFYILGYSTYYGFSSFFLISLILDIIFWYLISCLIIWIYNKIKNRNKNLILEPKNTLQTVCSV